MYPCYSRNNFTANDIVETNDIPSEINSDTDGRSLCQDQLASQDQYLDSHLSSCVDVLLEDELFCNFLGSPANYGLNQDDNYEEKLFPDILKLAKLDESSSEAAYVDCDSEQPSTSRVAKRPFVDIECGSLTPVVSPKRIDLIQCDYSKECCDESHVIHNFPVKNIDSDVTDDNLHQDGNCEEKLFSDIPKLSKLVESSSETTDLDCDIKLPAASRAAKRPFVDIECGPLTPVVSLERIDLKQSTNSKEYYDVSSVINDFTVNNIDSNTTDLDLVSATNSTPLVPVTTETKSICCHKDITLTGDITTTSIAKNDEQLCYPAAQQHAMKKGLVLRYHRDNLFYSEFNSSIYRNAIKKIPIDSNRLFKSSVSEEIASDIRYRGIIEASIDLSTTYLSVRKYVLNRVSPFIRDIMPTIDISITPGMSISDMKCNCISNRYFFEKLRENCEKIIESTRATPDNYFSNILQSFIGFNFESNSNTIYKRNKFSSKRDKFFPKIKTLIIDTISNLPQSIISEIKGFDDNEVLKGLFLNLHGVSVPRSLMRSLVLFSNCSKDKIANVIFEDNLHLLNNLLEKIGNLVRTSCILHEGNVSLPDEFLVEKMSKYVLSDMYGVPAKFHKKLDLYAKNIAGPSVLSNAISSESLSYTEYGSILKKIEQLEQCSSSVMKPFACETFNKYVTLDELKIKPYRCNLHSIKVIESVYEYAIRKISVDNDGLFKSNLLEELDSIIVGSCFSKSSIDLSSIYSDVRRYVLDKVSPCINNIMATADIFITTGMSLPDIKSNCLSNRLFFEKLRENCERMTEDILLISEDVFLSMVRGYIRFGSDGYLSVVTRKNKICSKIKELIIETIHNLPQSIFLEIENFEQSEILKGIFSYVHGVFVSKSLIRNINSYFECDRKGFSNYNFKDNIDVLNKLLAKLGSMVRTSFIFHEGNVTLPGDSVVERLSKYLLLDIYGFPFELHKKLRLFAEDAVEPSGSSADDSLKSFNCKLKKPNIIVAENFPKINSESNLTSVAPLNVYNIDILKESKKDVVNDTYENTELKLKSEKFTLIPKINSRWDSASVTSLNIYKLAISMIDIDKGEFENSFVSKIEHKELTEIFNRESDVNLNFSVTYERIKNYILEVMFYPFMTEIEEETKVEINLHNGITLDELEYSYISNERFFSKLSNFCDEMIKHVENISADTLTDMMQYSVYLETGSEAPKKIVMRKRKRISFSSDIAQLLVTNISSIPEKIVNYIKLLPRSKLIEEYFSRFNDMYVDNKSLLKVKLVFDSTKEKIINDKILSRLVDKISSDIVAKFGDGKRIDISKRLYGVVNSYRISKKLSTINYIRRLVREEFPGLRCNLSGPIVIVYSDKIEMASQKIKFDMLHKFESDLIEYSIGLYKSLCFKAYKSKAGRC